MDPPIRVKTAQMTPEYYGIARPSQPRRLDIPLVGASAESVFSSLVQRGNGGTTVRSLAAPALSTQFVKSGHTRKAQSNREGSFAEIIYPSTQDLALKYNTKHEGRSMFEYSETISADCYSTGYGERSARALAREDSAYQLKGTFPSAALALAKLKARTEARGGDPEALNRIFARMWGLPETQVGMLPELRIAGSEKTRMAAMEDRAYHSLSGHPAFSGGFRVDLATVTPDAVGEDVPMNWPRLRTGLKAVAMAQIQGDAAIYDAIRMCTTSSEFRFCMDIVVHSQPEYTRSCAWENLLDKLMAKHDDFYDTDIMQSRERDVGFFVSSTMLEDFYAKVLNDPEKQVSKFVQEIAAVVAPMSSKAAERMSDVILEYDHERALVDFEVDDENVASGSGGMLEQFNVPKYKVQGTGLWRGMKKENLGASNLPDVTSHGPALRILSLTEMREAKLTMPVDVAGALNLAVFLTIQQPSVRPYAYQLLVRMPSSIVAGEAPISQRFRKQHLYDAPRIRELGDYLFSDTFMNTFDLIVKNMAATEYRGEWQVKKEVWTYLNARCVDRRACPWPGSWRDLVPELRTCTEGWTLYYWARITIGKIHKSMSSGMFAPIAAGTQIDFLTLVKRGVRERATYWASYYAARYKAIEESLETNRQKTLTEREKIVLQDEEGADASVRTQEPGRYVPPHVRRLVELEQTYDAEKYLNRNRGYLKEQYEQMVEMQSKSKFFAGIEAYTRDRQIIVGIPDTKMRGVLIEFYQARWYSLHKRLEKAKEAGYALRVGPHVFEEHPWGDLIIDYPLEVGEVLQLMMDLEPAGWTINPGYLYEKLKKSINELWEDISMDISSTLDYIRTVHESLADEQEAIIEAREAQSLMFALQGVDPIPLPKIGYAARIGLPERTILPSQSQVPTPQSSVPQISTNMLTMTSIEPGDSSLIGDLSGFDDEDDSMMLMQTLTVGLESAPLQVQQQQCLSYRDIWAALGMPEVSDEIMKQAFALPAAVDLESQHLNSDLGPVMLKGDEMSVVRAWRHKVDIMRKRLKQSVVHEVVDDL